MVERKGRTGTTRSTGTGRENYQNNVGREREDQKWERKVSGRSGCVSDTDKEQQRLIKVN